MKRIAIVIASFFLSVNYSYGSNIIATVNNNAITDLDIKKRIEVLVATGAATQPDIANNISNFALNQLINDRLIIEEAKKLNLKIAEEELSKAIAILEHDNNLPSGQLEAFMKTKNLEISHVIEQLKTQMLWQKIMMYKIKPSIKITDEEIANSISDPKAFRVKIFFVENTGSEKEFKDLYKNPKCHYLAKYEPKSTTVSLQENIIDNFRPEIKKAITQLKTGTNSSIIKIDGKEAFVVLCHKTLLIDNEIKENIRNQMLNDKISAKANAYITKLRRENKIIIW